MEKMDSTLNIEPPRSSSAIQSQTILNFIKIAKDLRSPQRNSVSTLSSCKNNKSQQVKSKDLNLLLQASLNRMPGSNCSLRKLDTSNLNAESGQRKTEKTGNLSTQRLVHVENVEATEKTKKTVSAILTNDESKCYIELIGNNSNNRSKYDQDVRDFAIEQTLTGDTANMILTILNQTNNENSPTPQL